MNADHYIELGRRNFRLFISWHFPINLTVSCQNIDCASALKLPSPDPSVFVTLHPWKLRLSWCFFYGCMIKEIRVFLLRFFFVAFVRMTKIRLEIHEITPCLRIKTRTSIITCSFALRSVLSPHSWVSDLKKHNSCRESSLTLRANIPFILWQLPARFGLKQWRNKPWVISKISRDFFETRR